MSPPAADVKAHRSLPQLDQVAECHQGLIDRLDVAIGGKSVVAEDESGKVAFQGSPHTIASASISTS